MSSGITSNQQLFSVRQVPWHGLGTIVQEAPCAEEAIKLAHLDWKVESLPMFYGKNQVGSRKAENVIANVRSDTHTLLGIVTNNYKVVNNQQAFEFTNSLLDCGAKFETAGSLEGGKKVWMLAKLPNAVNLLGDEIDNYLLFANNHDGKGAVRVCITLTRVVCKNTLQIALSTAKRSWTTRHMGDMDSKLAEASRTLELNNKYTKAMEEAANRLAETKISDAEFEAYLAELLPMDCSATERKQENVIKIRTEIQTRYTDAPDLQGFRGTLWGVTQALTDFVGHSEPLRKSITFEENRFAQLIDGSPLLDRATELMTKKFKVLI